MFFVALFSVTQRDSITGGLVGLALSYSMQVKPKLNNLIIIISFILPWPKYPILAKYTTDRFSAHYYSRI